MQHVASEPILAAEMQRLWNEGVAHSNQVPDLQADPSGRFTVSWGVGVVGGLVALTLDLGPGHAVWAVLGG